MTVQKLLDVKRGTIQSRRISYAFSGNPIVLSKILESSFVYVEISLAFYKGELPLDFKLE